MKSQTQADVTGMVDAPSDLPYLYNAFDFSFRVGLPVRLSHGSREFISMMKTARAVFASVTQEPKRETPHSNINNNKNNNNNSIKNIRIKK